MAKKSKEDKDMMFWIIQGLGLWATICTCMSFFQKEKWKMMVYLSVTNVLLIVTYILCGSLLGGMLCLGALVRTIVYLYFNKTNKKPGPIVLVMFEIYYLVMSIFMWKTPIDLLMIINLVVVTYTSWQDDVSVLRLGYVISSLLLICYDVALGAYMTAVSEVAMLVSVVVALLKYAKVTKSYHNVAQRYFVANQNFWGSSVEVGDNFDMVTSTVDSLPFYNFGILKNYSNLQDTIMEIKAKCEEKNVKDVAYLPFDAQKYNECESSAHMLNMFFPVEFHDVWMKLIDGFNLNNTKCRIKNVEYRQIDESGIEDMIEVYLKGYHSKNNMENLSQNEKSQVENLKKIKLNTMDENGYMISAFVAYFNGIPVSLCVFLSNKVEAFVTKVSTIPIFRRKHIASSLMQFGISALRKKGVQEIMLVTDKYSTQEKFYAFNNFVEFGQAFALDVTDVKKYENFTKNNKIG